MWLSVEFGFFFFLDGLVNDYISSGFNLGIDSALGIDIFFFSKKGQVVIVLSF